MPIPTLFLKLASIPFYWFNVFLTLLIIFPWYLYRLFVVKLAKKVHPEWGEMLAPRDSFLATDNVHKKPLITVTAMAVLDGSPSLNNFRDLYEENVIWAEKNKDELCYPQFQQYFERWMGHLFWKWDEQFDVENHIKPLKDEEGKERHIWKEEDVIQMVGTLTTKPFPPKRPYWEIWFVENLEERSDSGNGNDRSNHMKSAVIFRVHHAMADGYSLLKVLMSNLCGINANDIRRPPWKAPGMLDRLRLYRDVLFRLPYLHTKQLCDTDKNIWFKPEKELSKDLHSTWTRKIPIQIIKDTSRQLGITFTSVLLAGLAGGIRKYFHLHGMEEDIPEVMRAMSPMPWMGHPIETLTNHWSCVSIPVPTGKSTLQERLKQAEETMSSIKGSPVPMANFYVPVVWGTWPVTLRERMWQNYIGTLIMSNFPGPSKKICFGGTFDIVDMAFWAPIVGGSGAVSVTMLSYKDSLRFSFLVEKSILKKKSDAEELTALVEQEFHNMRAEASKL